MHKEFQQLTLDNHQRAISNKLLVLKKVARTYGTGDLLMAFGSDAITECVMFPSHTIP
jgi:hypothetical protein